MVVILTQIAELFQALSNLGFGRFVPIGGSILAQVYIRFGVLKGMPAEESRLEQVSDRLTIHVSGDGTMEQVEKGGGQVLDLTGRQGR